MPFNDYPQYLRDILNSAGNIRDFRAGMNVDQIRLDRKTEAAVERELQIIAEAAARMADQGPALCPGVDLACDPCFRQHLASCLRSLGSGGPAHHSGRRFACLPSICKSRPRWLA